MPAPEIRPFADDDLDGAAVLLAERHRRHRRAEPLLPARYEDPAAAREEIEALWAAGEASGAVGLRDGRVVAYVLGTRKSDETWGPNVWVDPAGHAAEQAEDVRDVYAVAAARWADEGRTRHWAVVPASDAELLDAWYRLSFGQQHAYGLRKLDAAAPPVNGVRPAEERDVEAILELVPLLGEHQQRSPVFGFSPLPEGDALRTLVIEDIANAELGDLLAEADGHIVGEFQVMPIELSDVHAGLARVERASFLSFAVTRPDLRGTGVGVNLTNAAFAWAREHGYERMVTDWRVTNLLSSRFWPRRGFRTSFLRLYRSIP